MTVAVCAVCAATISGDKDMFKNKRVNEWQTRSVGCFFFIYEDIWISSVGYKRQGRSFYVLLVDVSAGSEAFVSLRWDPKVVLRLDWRKSGLPKTKWIPLVYREASGSTRFLSLSFLVEKSGIDLFCLTLSYMCFFLPFLGANCILIYFVIRLCPASYQSSLLSLLLSKYSIYQHWKL